VIVVPLVAGQAAAEMLASVVNLNQWLFAFCAVRGHQLELLMALFYISPAKWRGIA